jgi:catechol 2,3-dioxygenase-like lactoylglutathione lyase family enzyme
MIKGIKFVSVPVTDPQRSLEFYTKALGMRVLTDQPFNDQQRWIELGFPRADTGLVLFTGRGQEKMIGGFMNISFTADDVEAPRGR